MSILDWEGFDQVVTLESENPNYVYVAGGGATTGGGGRFGGRTLLLSDSDTWTVTGLASLTTFGIGFAILDSETTDHTIGTWGDLTLSRLNHSTTQNLVLKRGATTLFTSANGLWTPTWHHIVFHCTIHGSTGSYRIWFDNVDITGGLVTGVDTSDSFASLTQFNFSAGNTIQFDVDDVYWQDDLTYRGELRIASLLPNGNGNSSQFTGSDGNSTDNYLLVDDPGGNNVDDDTTYVGSSTVGHIDSYAMGNLPSVSARVEGVLARFRARKTDAGARNGQTLLRSGGTNYVGTSQPELSTYFGHRKNYLVDPNTGVAFTESGVNALEAGQKVAA